MLSLARSNAASRCIRCAIRSQRLTLQQLRLKSPSSRPKRDYGSNASKIRYTSKPRGAENSGRNGGVRKPFSGPNDRFKGGGRRQKDFPEMLQERLQATKEELKDAPIVEHYLRERREAGDNKEDFDKLWKTFTRVLRVEAERLETPFFGGGGGGTKGKSHDQLTEDLRLAFNKRGQRGLDDRIKYAFYAQVTGARFTESDIKNQKGLADLRYPTEWFPATRSIHRTIHLHVGPTNSGKTYHALQRLEQAERGAYAGPLRLLAHEVYTRMTAKGKNCALITGEERRLPEEPEDGKEPTAYMTSCTVEMMPLNNPLDVAVIDEIQMIGNAERGWAWTQALLGVQAREVHLCGEERTVPLIKELCASVGEKLVIHKYERLSPLKVADESLNGKIKDLRKGDCVVSFSVMGIHALRQQIERATGRKVATVYGSLPPETRAQQARLFNDPDNEYDFLVASDAVGMGLNLAIKRVIFEASNKFDGAARRTLSVADIKQIGGRAGRYRTAAQATETTTSEGATGTPSESPGKVESEDSVGIVTTLEKFDFPVVRAAMESEPEPIRTAGIFPPDSVLERFSSYFPPGTPFSYIMTRLHELSLMHKRFHLCGLKDQIWVADLIEPVQGLTIADRSVICSAPAGQGDADLWRELMPAYARIIAEQSGGNLVDIPQLPLEVLEAELSPSREYLRELERLHKGIVTYLWLSYRFAGLFTTRALAFHVKTMVEERIEEVLDKFSFTEAQRRKIAANREKQLLSDISSGAVNADGIPVAETPETSDQAQADENDDLEQSQDPAEVDEPERDPLEEQTTLTSGGDRFGGEEDFGFEEPGEMDAVVEAELETEPEKIASAEQTFAAWRNRQTKGESQGPDESEGGALETAYEEGEEAARQALQQNDTLEQLGETEPTVADVGLDVGSPSIVDLDFGPSQPADEAPEGSSSTADQQQQPRKD